MWPLIALEPLLASHVVAVDCSEAGRTADVLGDALASWSDVYVVEGPDVFIVPLPLWGRSAWTRCWGSWRLRCGRGRPPVDCGKGCHVDREYAGFNGPVWAPLSKALAWFAHLRQYAMGRGQLRRTRW